MPDIVRELSTRFTWAPGWVFSLIVIGVALVVLQLGYNFLIRLATRALGKRDSFFRSLLARTRGLGRLALVIAAVSWGVRMAPLPPRPEGLIQHGLLVAFILLCGWVLMTASDIGTALYMRRHRTDVADNLHARKMLTQTRILRRSLNVLILVVTAAMALMTIPGVKQIGVSLLAAGGAAGIIVGLALQPVLSNIMAGIQIAFTQPIRLDDAIQVNGEFGHVEEIKSTYVVIRLRDLRRLIVPLKFFLEQPFQNWTRESSDLYAEVLFQVDQRVPMDRLREAVEDAVRASSQWDGNMLKVQLNEIREKSMEIRCLAGVHSARDATDLRADVREAVIGWLQREYPDFLPNSGDNQPREPARPRAPSDARPGPRDQRVQ